MTDTIHVSAEKPYDVTVSRGCIAQLPELVRGRRTALIHAASLTGLAGTVGAELGEDTLLVDVPDGERAKTPETLVGCWDRLAAAGFTRSDVVVGLGGGSTTDLAGFVAASWLRGVRYVSVPTTVLAMVDAAVGGKTGINLSAGKNLVGAFYEPSAVLCDLGLLTSLPREEISSGLAEIVKAGFISDQRITRIVAADAVAATVVTGDALAELVRLSIQMKADVVSVDLRERTGEGEDIGRESLNYGHTLGPRDREARALPTASRRGREHRHGVRRRGRSPPRPPGRHWARAASRAAGRRRAALSRTTAPPGPTFAPPWRWTRRLGARICVLSFSTDSVIRSSSRVPTKGFSRTRTRLWGEALLRDGFQTVWAGFQTVWAGFSGAPGPPNEMACPPLCTCGFSCHFDGRTSVVAAWYRDARCLSVPLSLPLSTWACVAGAGTGD
jgi:3-dehydroquinate synthetase